MVDLIQPDSNPLKISRFPNFVNSLTIKFPKFAEASISVQIYSIDNRPLLKWFLFHCHNFKQVWFPRILMELSH